MNTMHKKSTLPTNIDTQPMVLSPEKCEEDMYNSKHKDMLHRNQDGADAAIMVQTMYWEEGKRGEKDVNTRSSVAAGLSPHLYESAAQEQAEASRGEGLSPPSLTSSASLSLSKLTGLRSQQRKQYSSVIQDSHELERQRRVMAEALSSLQSNSPTILAPVPSDFSVQQSHPAPPTPVYTLDKRVRRKFYNRDPESIAEARRYLEVIVRSARDDHSTAISGPSFLNDDDDSDAYFSDAETDIYDPEDSATLLSLRLHPLNTSNAQEIVDDILKNERIIRAGYRGKDIAMVAQSYELGKKRLVRELMDIVPWDQETRREEQAKLLVDQLLRYR